MIKILLFALLIASLAQECPKDLKTVPLSPDDNDIRLILQNLDTFFTNKIKDNTVPGYIATLVYDQQILWSKGYGRNDPFGADPAPPTIDSIVRIASISKLFAVFNLLHARDQGLVALDDPLTNFFSNFSMKRQTETTRPLTLRQLASQTSGLPREVPCPWSKLGTCGPEEIFASAKNQYYVLPQYARGHYSNFAFALLGRALEGPSKMTFEDYLNKHCFSPLGMSSSTCIYSPEVEKRMAVGTDITPDGKRVKAQYQALGWSIPMGGIFSTARDMSRFMSLMFRSTEKANSTGQVLDGATINEWLTSVIEFSDGKGGFGLGWEPDYVAGYWVHSKAGELSGFRSQIAIIPALKIGLFVSATITEVSGDPTSTVYTAEALTHLLPALTNALKRRQPVFPLPPKAKAWVGRYSSPQGDPDVEFYIEEERLYFSVVVGDKRISPQLCLEFPGEPLLLKVHNPSKTTSCRWMDDGNDREIAYGTFNSAGDKVTSYIFMGQPYTLIK